MIKVYLSYSWSDESAAVASQVKSELADSKIKLIIDKDELLYKGDIKEFMLKLGNNNFVIIIISDKYLKSDNCMFELITIYQHEDFKNRVFPIILNDVKVFKPIDKMDYSIYWENEISNFNEKVTSLSPQSRLRYIEDEKVYLSIKESFEGIINSISNMNSMTLKIHIESNFRKIIDSIISEEKSIEPLLLKDSLSKPEYEKIIDYFEEEFDVADETAKWLENNLEHLFNLYIDEFYELFSSRKIASMAQKELFQEGVIEHFQLLAEMLYMGTEKIPKEKHISLNDFYYQAKVAYSNYFEFIIGKVKNNDSENLINKDSADMLIKAINAMLKLHYS